MSPQPGTALGIKGVSEADTVGALAEVWCTMNDALRPFGVCLTSQPFTPEIALATLAAACRVREALQRKTTMTKKER